MATLSKAITVSAPFNNATEVRRVKYDFSQDTGAVADYTILTASGALLVKCIGLYTTTAATSGGSATLEVGKGTSGAEFVSAEAYTSFTLAGFYGSESANWLKLADGEVINMGIATAALTAGVIEFIFEVAKV